MNKSCKSNGDFGSFVNISDADMHKGCSHDY